MDDFNLKNIKTDLTEALSNASVGSTEVENLLRIHADVIPYFGDGKNITIAGRPVGASYAQLANWLFSRVSTVSVDQAINDLLDFAAKGYYQLTYCRFIEGLKIVESHSIGENKILTPVDKLPAEYTFLSQDIKNWFDFLVRKGEQAELPTCVLIEVVFKSFMDFSKNRAEREAVLTKLQEDRRSYFLDFKKFTNILSIFGVHKIKVRGCVELPADTTYKLPHNKLMTLTHSSDEKPIVNPKLLSITTLKEIEYYLNKLERLDDEKVISRWDIVFERLRRCVDIGTPLQDKILDLATILEILLLPGIEDELTFRLALRASKLLSQDYTEKVKIKKIFQRFYKMRSKVIHEGSFGKNISAQQARTCTNEIQKFVVEIVKKILIEPNIDFDRLELD